MKQGFRVNYSRAPPGTRNAQSLCRLDDVFFELLWLDGSPVSAETERIGLAARGRGEWFPIGVSWRGPTTLETVPYAAPFLPNGRVIHMAVASLNTNVPFVFQSPGGIPPINRSDGLPGDRQRPLAGHSWVLPAANAKSRFRCKPPQRFQYPWSSGRPSRLAGNSARRRRPRRLEGLLGMQCEVLTTP